MYKINMVPEIIFGCGAVKTLAGRIPAQAKVLIVTSPSAEKNGNLAELCAALGSDITTNIYAETAPEPTIQEVDKVREIFRQGKYNAVIALGGGSVLDVGKVTAAAAFSDIPTADFFYNRAALPERGVFMAALPTTAGTGAEVTPNGVFTDKESNIKQSIRGGTILPALALVDPGFCVSCPAALTAASGLDALTQGIESYISRNSNNTTRALAAQGVKLIDQAIEKAFRTPDDLAARSDMSEGTLLGAMAFAVSGLGAVHGLAHPLGAKLHLPHGLVCGILLGKVLEHNSVVCRKQLTELAEFTGYSSAEQLIGRVYELLEKFNIDPRLAAYGLKAEDLPWIVGNSRSGSMRANPRDYTDAELTALLEEIM